MLILLVKFDRHIMEKALTGMVYNTSSSFLSVIPLKAPLLSPQKHPDWSERTPAGSELFKVVLLEFQLLSVQSDCHINVYDFIVVSLKDRCEIGSFETLLRHTIRSFIYRHSWLFPLKLPFNSHMSSSSSLSPLSRDLKAWSRQKKSPHFFPLSLEGGGERPLCLPTAIPPAFVF